MHSNTRQAVRVDAFGLREMVLGKSRQAHQRTIMHSNTRQAANNHAPEHSTGSERVDAFGLREMVLGKSRQAHQRTQSLPSATHRHSSITRPCCSSAQAPSFLSFTRAHQRTIMHSNTRQAANNHALEHSTGSERVDAFGLREMVLGKSRQAHQRTAGSPANAKLTFRYPSSLINHSTLLLERSSAKLLVFYASTRSRRAVEVIICMITRDFSVISIDVTGVSLSLYHSQKSLTHNIGNATAFPIIFVYRLPLSSCPLLKKCLRSEDHNCDGQREDTGVQSPFREGEEDQSF